MSRPARRPDRQVQPHGPHRGAGRFGRCPISRVDARRRQVRYRTPDVVVASSAQVHLRHLRTVCGISSLQRRTIPDHQYVRRHRPCRVDCVQLPGTGATKTPSGRARRLGWSRPHSSLDAVDVVQAI